MKKRFMALGLVFALGAVGIVIPEPVALVLVEAIGAAI
jgi:hypothetical protein